MGAVLIVDDIEDLRYSLSALVRKDGYTAFTAPDGASALDTAATSVIDLIFLDIGLPDTDGISLIGRLKEINPDVDIVMLTGINDAKTAVDCLRAGPSIISPNPSTSSSSGRSSTGSCNPA